MNSQEIRATVSLAAIFALRMLGLFLILPVFSVYAKTVPGGDNALLVGLALGIYGLAQAFFYIPYGWLSDWLGRKPVIIAGLLVFALGSLVAALASDLTWIIIGRALQGAGAISSVLTALLADLTTTENRTKAMAMVGASIGVSFAVALVAAPTLFGWLGMSGLFSIIGLLAVASIGVVLWVVPTPAAPTAHSKAPFTQVLRHAELLRLNFGVFVLHFTQIALFIVVPHLLETAGLPITAHWKIYLPVMGLSFVLMIPAIIAAGKYGRMKTVLLIAILCILLSQLSFAEFPPTLWWLAGILTVYFTGFNVLEAVQPSLISTLAPGARKGAAMGIYNTVQALGYFMGGVFGGWLLKNAGYHTVFISCAVLVVAWLIIAANMQCPRAARFSESMHRIDRGN